MTTLHYPSPGDWLLSSDVLDDAMQAIDDRFTISREFHIPYLAGYSKDGRTIYIDSRMPEGFNTGDDKRWVSTDQFLILHEAVEKALLSFFLKKHQPVIYEFAHQIALRAEQAAVEAQGVDWKAYNKFMGKCIMMCEAEGYDNIPDQLDLQPYVNESDPHVAEMIGEELARP